MELYSGQINKLIDELAALPGIGSKSAQRLAFHLINMPKDRVDRLANGRIDTILRRLLEIRLLDIYGGGEYQRPGSL